MGNKTLMLMLCVALISLLVLSGCKGKSKGSEADLNAPPPLPEEAGAEEGGQPPAPPSTAGQQSAPGQQPAGLPLLG